MKSPVNPVTNSGHETCLFPYGEGVLAICGHDGPEKDTIQYAADGLNFDVVAHVTLPPLAAGPFAPDSYCDTREGKGITWGLSHIATEEMKTRQLVYRAFRLQPPARPRATRFPRYQYSLSGRRVFLPDVGAERAQ